MTDQEAIWQFLTDLKYQREVAKRLYEKARSNPQAVILYIESLGEDWEMKESEETLFQLKKAHRIALEVLKN